MYLADRMLRVARRLDGGALVASSPNAGYMVSTSRKIVENYELYAFERSALAAAADLRIDTPERLEAVFEAVLRQPRRIFMEALHQDRAEILSSMRGFPIQDLQPGRSHPQRVGLAVDIQGAGRARIEVLWNFAPRDVTLPLSRADLIDYPKAERDAIIDLTVMGVAFNCIQVDLSARAGLPRDVFEMLAADEAKGDEKLAELLRAARRIVGPGEGKAWQRRVITEAWRMARLNEYCSMDAQDGAILAAAEVGAATGRSAWDVISDARSDLDGEVIHAVAMLSLLEVDTPDIARRFRKTPQPVATRKQRPGRRKQGAAPDDRFAPLSIVTLNFSDEALERSYSRGEMAPAGTGNGGKRARHMVRGHLFRARNGKMVYRRPHWRGSAPRPVLHKVRR